MRSRKVVRRSRGRVRRLVLVGSMLLTSLAVAVGLAELVLRLAAPQPPSWLDIYREGSGSRPYDLLPNTTSRVTTGEGTWSVTTDAQGLRVAPAQARPVGAAEVVFLGDSFTFGQGVTDEDTFVARIAAKPGMSLRLHNAGVCGYGPVQYRQVLEEWLGIHPAPLVVVVVVFTGNDFHDCVWDKRVPVRNGILGDPGGMKSWLKRNTHLYRLLSRVQQRWMPAADPRAADFRLRMQDPAEWAKPPLSEAEPIFRREVATISQMAGGKGATVLGVIIPSRDLVERGAAEVSEPVRRAAQAFDQAGVPWIDATAALRELGASRAYLRHDGHLTPEGNAALADVLARRLATIGTAGQAGTSEKATPP